MTIWSTMKVPISGQFSLRLIQVCSYGNWSWLKDHEEKVGIALELNESIDLDGFPISKFFTIENIENTGIPNVLIVVCKEETFFDIFEILCKDLLVISENSTNLQEAISLLKQRLISWTQLFKKMKQLSLQQMYGLISELLFLEIWIANGQQVDTWLGPHNSPQDFITKNLQSAIEIKTTSNNLQTISISSLEQLDFQGKLFLIAIPLSPTDADNPKAISLNSLVSKIREKIEPQHLKTFEEKIILAGYSKDQEISNFLVESSEPKIYYVTKGFPRILKKDVPGEILKCNYEINLIRCDTFRISKSTLFAEL